MSNIWAKSNEITLEKHTIGLLNDFENLLKYSVYKNKINEELELKEIINICIALHDIGKSIPSFQISVGNFNYDYKSLFPKIPHSIFSLFFIDNQSISDQYKKSLYSAVAFHHYRNNFESIIFGLDSNCRRGAEKILEDKNLKDNLLEALKNIFRNNEELKRYEKYLGFNQEFAEIVKDGDNLLNYLIPPYNSYFLPTRIMKQGDLEKKKWIYIMGSLIRTDHFTSYKQEENINDEIENSDVDYDNVDKQIFKYIKDKEEMTKTKWWQFGIVEKCKNKNTILIAPTGDGKTEFALLWGRGKKSFFNLPLRSAVNAIYERIFKMLEEKNKLALLHSDADVYLLNSFKENNELESLRVFETSKHLVSPIIVSTGDQIFPVALKYPGYERMYSVLGCSNLIIDEIQAYDPRAMAIVIKLIEDIVKLGGNFLLMTATLPNFIKDEIKRRIGNNEFQEIDRYDGYSEVKKHKINVIAEDIENKIDEIVDKGQKNRVLVIANTVDKAQNIFQKIKDKNVKNICLLHSKFTLNDRKEKETDLLEKFKNPKPQNEGKGKILIATQVVEASLDIDADFLYTEIAPIDSLVQRMGRVLRRIKNEKFDYKGEPNINIFWEKEAKKGIESGKGYVYKNDALWVSLAILLKIEIKFSDNDKKNDEIEKIKKNVLKKIKVDSMLLSEKEKKEMVEKLYDLLEKSNSDYIKTFYDTLSILDSGYVSNRKEEAQKMFREMFTVPAISCDKKKDLLEAFEEFLQQENISYTKFKQDIVSKFIVNINIRTCLKYSCSNISQDVIEEMSNKCNDIEKLKKLKNWLSDFYFYNGKYDSNTGVIIDKKDVEDSFII